jgi:hypothetical protein
LKWPDRLIRVEAKGVTSGSEWEVIVERIPGAGSEAVSTVTGILPDILFIDPAEESQAIQRHFQHDANAQDLLEGTDAAALSEEWRDHASRILRRDYDSIEVFEVEGPDGDDVVPWFQISSMGARYDTFAMGRGELSALYLLWKLSKVAKNSIVIVDEPEAWLASFSQARLKEAFAYMSVQDGLNFVLTTHSPEMYLGLPDSRVTILESLPEPASYGPMASPRAAHSLGAPIRPSLALLTEDSVASALLESIIRACDSATLEAVEIFQAQNGESALAQVQREFIDGNMRPRRLKLQVVLDGDQRQMSEGRRRKGDAGVYLPGDAAPDATLKRVVTKVISGLSDEQLRREGVADPVRFRLAIGAAAGSEHHDWFVEVSTGFTSYVATSDVLVRLCMLDGDFEKDARSLMASIASALT